MELSVAIQAKVEVTPSNWNFGFQPTYLLHSFCAGFSFRILCVFSFPSEPCIRLSSHLFPGNCWAQIHSQSSMHPDLMEGPGRDAFGTADAS